MSGAVPLLPPSLLTLHAACLASSTLARSCVGTMRWHACVCRVATSIHPLVQLTSSPTAYGQTPSVSPPCKAAATVTSLLPARARLLYRRAEPSPPSLSLLALARVAPMQCATIKGTSPVHFVCASGFTVHRFWST
jgi:hypothetical protein